VTSRPSFPERSDPDAKFESDFINLPDEAGAASRQSESDDVEFSSPTSR
jgi:hypothetical protein